MICQPEGCGSDARRPSCRKSGSGTGVSVGMGVRVAGGGSAGLAVSTGSTDRGADGWGVLVGVALVDCSVIGSGVGCSFEFLQAATIRQNINVNIVK